MIQKYRKCSFVMILMNLSYHIANYFREKIDAVLPKIDGMFSGGMITLEKAHVICYRGGK